jgi:hypothetical protein
MTILNYDLLNYDKSSVNIYQYKDGVYASRKAAYNPDHIQKLILDVPEGHTYKIVLECSTCGDLRFSAYGAKIEAFKCLDIIEFHYFLAKGFDNIQRPEYNSSWLTKKTYVDKVKGKPWDYMILGNSRYDSDLIFQWYHMLWIRYLDLNPELVEYLKLFDDYNDVFKGKSRACQADSIRKYIKDGRDSLLAECEELNSKFNNPMK